MIGQITGETIKSAVAKCIVQNFTVDSVPPKVYKEQIVQGFTKPAFFIWIIDLAQSPLLGNRLEQTYQMNVRYHIDEKDNNKYQKLSHIGIQLLEALRTINVPIGVMQAGELVEINKPVRGRQMNFQITDDVLQVFVTYTIKGYIPEQEQPNMQTLTVNEASKVVSN